MKTKFTFIVLAALCAMLNLRGANAQTSGACGDDLTWTLTNNTLTISGTGEMTNYFFSAPWYALRATIQELIIGNSVTTIGNDAFRGCSVLTSITIGNSVTTIGNSAFRGCSGLTAVTIPNSVTTIGEGAFNDCYGLTAVTIPNSVKTIGSSAFGYCSGLTSVSIGNSVRTIGGGAFQYCSGMTSVTIPNSVKTIGNNAFWYCSGLTSIEVSGTNFKLADNVGSARVLNPYANNGLNASCSNVVGSLAVGALTIPNSVTSISNFAFSGCGGLTSVIIPNSVRTIGNSAFYDCSGLTSVTIPNSVTTIGSQAFYRCNGLTSITNLATTPQSISSFVFDGVNKNIPLFVPVGSVDLYGTAEGWEEFTNIQAVSIGGTCGANLTWTLAISGTLTISGTGVMTDYPSIFTPWYAQRETIKELIIGNSVTTIGNNAFRGCSGLTSVTIPNSVTTIGNVAFGYCSSLTSINNEAETPQSITSDVFNGVNKDIPLYVPAGSVGLYSAAEGWKDFTNIIGVSTGIENINDNSRPALQLYPNPVKSELYIQSGMQITQVNIYSLQGKHLKSFPLYQDNEKIDVSSLQSGAYIVKAAATGGKTYTGKFVKE